MAMHFSHSFRPTLEVFWAVSLHFLLEIRSLYTRRERLWLHLEKTGFKSATFVKKGTVYTISLPRKSSGEEDKTGASRIKASDDQYEPLIYRPAIILCSKVPKGYELILSYKMTKEYVEVGLIVGDFLEKHSSKGTKGALTMSTEASLRSPRSSRARVSTSRLWARPPTLACAST
jgi:hypothetical protein